MIKSTTLYKTKLNALIARDNKMKYSLYLDDERLPRTDAPYGDFWIVVRSVEEAKNKIAELGYPSHMSLDHDLGDGVPTGYDFVKWFVEDWSDQFEANDCLAFPECNYHTANPVGRENMKGYIENYLRFIGNDV